MILINITKVHCQTVSNRSDFTPTMLALVKDGVVHFIPLQAVHFKLIRTVQIILIYPVHLKVIWAVHLNRCNQIKKMFLAAGLTRPVVVYNPTTSEQEIRPLNEVASSHLARRCFVGNLYKQVKDPNLVGALSGHKEGSRAFARYREIDEDMKRDLVSMLE